MLNLNSSMIATKQPHVVATFSEQSIGKPVDTVEAEQGFYG